MNCEQKKERRILVNMIKRMLSAFLALVMVFGMVPVSAWASETDTVIIEETASVTETTEVAETEETPTESAVETTESEPEATTAPAETETQTEATEETQEQTEATEETVETEPEEIPEEETEPEETEPEETVEEVIASEDLANAEIDIPLGQCTDLRWDWPVAMWSDPDGADVYTEHTIEFYYAAGEDDEPECVESFTGFQGESYTLWPFIREEYGAGYYYFRVCVIYGDVEIEFVTGEWSDMSEGFWYDPDTVYLTEEYLQKRLDNGADWIELGEDLTLSKNFTLPENVWLNIVDGATLTVPTGVTLTASGNIEAQFGGSLVVESGGVLNLHGVVNVNMDATLDIQGKINFMNEWAEVGCYYDGGFVDCTISENVPNSKRTLNVSMSPDNEEDWSDTIAMLRDETGNYGQVYLYIYEDVTLPENMIIQPNTIVHMYNSYYYDEQGQETVIPAVLTIPEDVILTNFGEIYVQDGMTLNNNGTIDTYRGIWTRGKFMNRGTVNVFENLPNTYESLLSVQWGGHFENRADVFIYPNAYRWVETDSSWSGNSPVYVQETGNHEDLAGWLATLEPGSTAELSGDITLERNLTIPEDVYLTIRNGSLSVPQGVTLTMNGNIFVKENGVLDIKGRININTGLYVSQDGTLNIDEGEYSFGQNAYGVSGDIHCYYGESCEINGVDTDDVITEFNLHNDNTADHADILAAFLNFTENRSFLQIHTSLTLKDEYVIPENGEVHIWDELTVNGGVDCYGKIYTYDMAGNGSTILAIHGRVHMQPGSRMVTYGTVDNQGDVIFFENAVLERNNQTVAKWLGIAPTFLGGGSTDPDFGMTQAELEKQINALKKKGGNIKLTKPVVLERDLTLPANVGMEICYGGSVYVPEGVTLTLNGQVSLYWGGIWTAEDSSLVVGDFIYVNNGGTLEVEGDVFFTDERALVAERYESDYMAGTVSENIPYENRALYVYLHGEDQDCGYDDIEDCWADAIDVAEASASEYAQVFVCVYGDVTLPQDLTITENMILHVDSMNTVLTVPEGCTIYNEGEIYVWDSNCLYNKGTIENNGGIYVNGRLVQSDSGRIYNYSEGYGMAVEGAVENGGVVILYPYTELQCNGDWFGKQPLFHGGIDNLRTRMTAAALQKKVNSMNSDYQLQNTLVVLEKDLTVKGQLDIWSDSTLIVPAGKTLTVYGGGAIFLYDGADLIIEEGGSLIVKNGDLNGSAGAIYTYANEEYGGILKLDGMVEEGYWGCVTAWIDISHYNGDRTPAIDGFPTWMVQADMRLEGDNGGYSDETLVLWAMEHLTDPEDDLGRLFGQVQVWTDDLVLNTPLTIPSNAYLRIIPSEYDINYGSDNSWAQINSTVDVYGQLAPQPYMNGTPCQLRIGEDGIVKIHDGGALWSMGHVNNRGSIYCYVGGNIEHYDSFGGEWTGNDPEFVSGLEQDILEEQIANGNGECILSEGIVLERDLILTDGLTIGEGGHIIVPWDVTLTVDGGELWLCEGGKLTVFGTLIHNGNIQLHHDSALACWGTYVRGDWAMLERSDFDPEIMDFYGAIDGIDLMFQRVNVNTDNEWELYNALELAYWGWGNVVVFYDGAELYEDLYVPENVYLYFDSGVKNYANLIIDGYVDCGGGIDNSDENASITVRKGGALCAMSDTYCGKAPVLEKGALVNPFAREISINYGEPDLNVNVAEAAQGCLTVEVSGGEDVPRPLQFVTWTSSNKKVVDPADIVYVDGVYCITYSSAGTTTLTATSLASADGSSNGVSASIKVNVEAVDADILRADIDCGENEIIGSSDEKLTMLKSKENRSFLVRPTAESAEYENIPLRSKNIKWTVSDKAMATVETQPNGEAKLTVKAGAYGEFDLVGQMTDRRKATVTIRVAVQDTAPRLTNAKLTLNPLLTDGVQVALVESYGNSIERVSVADERLAAFYDNEEGMLTIRSVSENAVKKGNIKTTLTVLCSDEETYTYDLAVTLKSVEPVITIKQAEKMDLFYTDSSSVLSITAKDAQINRVELVGVYDFRLEENEVEICDSETEENGYTLRFTEEMIWRVRYNTKYKPDTKVTMRVYLEGYTHPVEKAFTIATTTTKLTLTSDPGSGVLNTALTTAPYAVSFRILDKKSKEVLELESADVFGDNITVNEEGRVVVNLGSQAKKTTATVSVQKENWMKPVQLKVNISVSTKAPVMKLGASTLTLYGPYPQRCVETTAVLDQGNLQIEYVDVTCKEGDAEKIWIEYADGMLTAGLDPAYYPENVPAPGTYSYTVTPYVLNQEEEYVALKPVTVKVKVVGNSGLPKAKLGSSTVKMNVALAGNEVARIPVTFKDTTGLGLEIVGFMDDNNRGSDTWSDNVFSDDYVTLTVEDGVLNVYLNTQEVFKKTYNLLPIAADPTGDRGSVPMVKLTVQSYETTKPVTVAQSAKGKLDTLNRDSVITYTVGKITNALGPVENVHLEGKDAWRFQVSGITTDAKGKQTFTLSLVEGETYSTKETYEVQFVYWLCGDTVSSAPVKVKVSQSAVKITATAGMFYLSQQSPYRVDLKVTSPATAVLSGNIDVDATKTSRELVDAIEEVWSYNDDDGNTAANFQIRENHNLKAGKSYKLVLNVKPEGAAENISTQVTVTVKVSK